MFVLYRSTLIWEKLTRVGFQRDGEAWEDVSLEYCRQSMYRYVTTVCRLAIGPKGVGTGYGEINGVNNYEDESMIK